MSTKKVSLDSLKKSLNKQFGDVAKTGQDIPQNVEIICSTGSYSLDLVIGCKGTPKGRIITLQGPESGGKTLYSLIMASEVQKSGGNVAFLDLEGTYTQSWASKFGVDVDNLLYIKPKNGGECLDIVLQLVENKVDFIVIDSVAVLTTNAEEEAASDQAMMAQIARLLSQNLKRIQSKLNQGSQSTICFINQLRNNIGGYGCFQHNTKVNFVDGRSYEIGYIVKNKIQGEVWAFDEKNRKFIPSKIINWHNNGKVLENSEFIHIETEAPNQRNGIFGFTCTKNHKLLTDVGWKKAENIQISDNLLTKYNSIVNGTLSNFLDGILIGDSHISLKGNSSQLILQDNKNEEYIKWKMSKLQPFITFKKCHNKYQSKSDYEFKILKQKYNKRNPIIMLNNYSDLAMAVWIMEDGCYDNSHKRYIISCKRFKNDEKTLQEIKKLLYKYNYDTNYNINNGSFTFTKKSSDILAKNIYKYVPSCMNYKLPVDLQNKYIDFNLDSYKEIKETYTPVKRIRNCSEKQLRQKNKFDLSIENYHNYMVGGCYNGIVAHNSPEVATGGKALKFYSSLTLDVRRKETLGDKDNPIGFTTKIKALKNKCGKPFREVFVDIYIGPEKYGIDKEAEIFSVACQLDIIQKQSKDKETGEYKKDEKGSHYLYKTERFYGLPKMMKYIEERPEEMEIIKKEVEVVMENKFKPKEGSFNDKINKMQAEDEEEFVETEE